MRTEPPVPARVYTGVRREGPMATDGTGIGRRLAPLRGRLALSRAAEDLQRGLPWGAGAAAALGLVHWLDLAAPGAGLAASVGAVVALAFPAAGAVIRRTSSARLASLVDERLGLLERVGTALALEAGEAPPTPLAGLVLDDARSSLDRVPSGLLRRAFRPALLVRPLAFAGAAALAAILLFRAEPMKPAEKPKDPIVAYREAQERKEAAKAARRVLEAAKSVEEDADPKQAALRAIAAELRRRSDDLLRTPPPQAEAVAEFRKMGELVRERMEALAGVDAEKLEEWKKEGLLSKPDGDLARLLEKLLGADLKGLNDQLAALDSSLKGEKGSKEWTPESLSALKEALEDLAAAVESSGGDPSERAAMKEGLKALGNPELLREIAERMARLMKTLEEQGWEACKNRQGLSDGSMDDFEPGEPIYVTDLQLQAMIDRLKELQAMAELGQFASCQGCGLSGGT